MDEIILNYDELDDIAKKSDSLKENIDTFKKSMTSFRAVVEENSGEAADVLKEKVPDIEDFILKLEEAMGKIGPSISTYHTSMSSIINAKNSGSDMKVPATYLRMFTSRLKEDLDTIASMPSGTFSMPNKSGIDEEDTSILAAWEENNQKLSRYNAVIDDIKASVGTMSSTYSDMLKKISDDVLAFQEMDETQAKLADDIYEGVKIHFWETTEGKIVIVVVTVTLSVVAIIFAGPIAAAVGGAIGLGSTGVAVLESVIFYTGMETLIQGGSNAFMDTFVGWVNGEVQSVEDAFNKAYDGYLKGYKIGLATGPLTGLFAVGTPMLLSKGSTMLSDKAPQVVSMFNSLKDKYPKIYNALKTFGKSSVSVVEETVEEIAEDVVKGEGFNPGKVLKEEIIDEVAGLGKENIIGSIDEMIPEGYDGLKKMLKKGVNFANEEIKHALKEADSDGFGNIFNMDGWFDGEFTKEDLKELNKVFGITKKPRGIIDDFIKQIKVSPAS